MEYEILDGPVAEWFSEGPLTPVNVGSTPTRSSKIRSLLYIVKPFLCGRSSVGRARTFQVRCREFEPRRPLHPRSSTGQSVRLRIKRLDVRIVLGVPNFVFARVAQLNRVRDSESRGRRFESSRERHDRGCRLERPLAAPENTELGSSIRARRSDARIDQAVEHPRGKREVASSILAPGSSFSAAPTAGAGCQGSSAVRAAPS